jgi:hypothetical protein
MNLKIDDISTLCGCSKRTAIRIKEQTNQRIHKRTGSKLNIHDLPHLYGVNHDHLLTAVYYQRRAFVTIADISRFFEVGRRQADNYMCKFRTSYRIQPWQKLTVVELAGLLNIPYSFIFPLMDDSIREPGIIKTNTLGKDAINRLKHSPISALDGIDRLKREYYSIAEFSDFWKKYRDKFNDNQAWDSPKFWAV